MRGAGKGDLLRCRRCAAAFTVALVAGALVGMPGGAGAAPTCTINWKPSGFANANFSNAANWVEARSPTSADYACVPSTTPAVTVTLSANATVKGLTSAEPFSVPAGTTLNLTDAAQPSELDAAVSLAGTLTGAGPLTLKDSVTWSSGQLAGTGSTTITASGSLLINQPTGTSVYLDRNLTNNGTITYRPGANAQPLEIDTNGGACPPPASVVLTNNATFDYQGRSDGTDPGIGEDFCGATGGVIHNAAGGTFTRSSGTDTAAVTALVQNDGTLTASAGAISLQAGGPAASGSFIGGSSGTVSFDGGQFTLAGAQLIGHTRINGGKLTSSSGTTTVGPLAFVSGVMNGAGGFSITGAMNWSGGQMADTGTTTVAASGALLIDQPAGKFVYLDRNLVNDATITYKPGANAQPLELDSNGGACPAPASVVLTNDGMFDYQGRSDGTDPGIAEDLCGATGGVIHNSVGATFVRSAGTDTADVTALVQNDGTLSASAGTLSLQGGGGSAAAMGTFTGTAPGVVSLDGGVFSLAGGARFAGTSQINGGTARLAAGTTTTVTALTLAAGAIAGPGALNVTGAMNWSGGQMAGTGTATVAGPGSLLIEQGAGTSTFLDRDLVNNGVITYRPGASAHPFELDTNAGACSGPASVTLTNNASFDYQGRSDGTDPGIAEDMCGASGGLIHNAAGTFTRSAGSDTGAVGVAFDNDGTLAANKGTLWLQGGLLNFSGGTLTGGTYVANAATLRASGVGVTTNAATVILDHSKAKFLDGSGAGALRNLATNSAAGSLTLKDGAPLATRSLTNAGSITIGPGTASALTVQTSFTQSGGSTALTDATSTLTVTGAAGACAIQGGTLLGIGTVVAAGSPGLTNAAKVSPGVGGVGTLHMTGSYAQTAAGNLAVEVNGATAAQADQLAVTGAAALAGTLTVTTGYSPALGDAVSVLTTASTSGLFNPVAGAELPGALSWQEKVNPTNVALRVVTPGISIGNVSVGEGASGTTDAVFPITLSEASAAPVTVHYATADGTATLANGDYQAASGTFTFPPFQTSGTITVKVNGDTTVEPDETFTVGLSSPTNATVTTSSATGTIVNDDFPADLGVTQTDSVDPVSSGATLTYAITVANAGPGTAYAVSVSDPVPAGTSFVSADSGGALSAGTVTWSLGAMANGAGTAVHMTVKVTSTSLTSLSNTATVSSLTPDPNSSNDAATESTAVSTPTVSMGDVSVGEGDSGTTNAVFPVTLSPASTVPVTVHWATADGTATIANSDYVAASGKLTIAAGQTTGSIAVKVKGDIAVEPDETFTVGLSAPTNSTIGTATGTGRILNDDSPADLGVTQTDSVDLVSSGANLTYAITVANGGPGTAHAVSVSDPLPAGTSFVSADSGGTPSAGTITWNLGTMASGAGTTVHVTVNVTPGGPASLSNTATVSSSTPDPNSSNDAATETTAVSAPVVSIGDVSVGEGDAGTTVASFPVTLSPASTVPVTVQYATADGTATIAGGDYQAAGGTLTFAAGVTTKSVGVKVNGDITIEPDEMFTVGLSAPTNSTIGTATGTGTILNDDSPADLGVTQTDSTDPAVAGTDLTYTVTVANLGAGLAHGVSVTDTVPVGTTFVSADSGGTLTGGKVKWTLGDVANGAGATLHMTVHIAASRTAALSATAAVTGTSVDPSPANNTATEPTAITQQADVSIGESPSLSPAVPGSPITYTVTIDNAGPSDATGVKASMVVPAGARVAGAVTVSDGGSYNAATGVASWPATSLAAGAASLVHTVTQTVSGCRSAALSSNAAVSSATADPNSANNTSAATTPVQPAPGGRLVFARSGQLWCINGDGSGASQLTSGADDESPSWSPDGTQIAFASDRSGNADIWVVNDDGTGLKDVTPSTPSAENAPDWGPSLIAFASDRTGVSQVWSVDPATHALAPHQITNGTGWALGADEPSWSPDGTSLALESTRSGASQIWVVTSGGGSARRLPSTDPAFAPAWSPGAGTNIAYDAGSGSVFEIFYTLADGTQATPTQFTVNGDFSLDPAWSPDGGTIAFDSGSASSTPDIFTLDVPQTTSLQLTADGVSSHPDWQPS